MDYLPGYWFDPRTHNYMTRLANGQVRFVARAQVMRLLEAQVDGKERLLAELTEAVIDGRLAPSVWQAQMAKELKRLYLESRALGAGGWDRLTARDFGHIGGRLASEYRYLARFAQQIADGEVTLGQALVRMRMYVGHARREYWLALREHRKPSRPDAMLIERRILGEAEHCEDCVRFAALGWQPAGILPPPTMDSQCNGNCRCTMLWQEIPMADLERWLGRTRAGGKLGRALVLADEKRGNPYHAEDGRFTFKPGGTSEAARGGQQQGRQYMAAAEVDQMAEAKAAEAIQRTAALFNVSEEAVKQQCVDNLTEVLKRPVVVRANIDAAESILEDGRFKTQFETKTSNGSYNPDFRRKAEEFGLGAPPDLDPSERPVYGYFGINDLPGCKHVASGYGNVKFILKEDIKDRATYTVGDSLGLFKLRELTGSPASDPRDIGGWDSQVENMYRADWGQTNYVEAQIQGGVTLSDISHIVFTRYLFDSSGGLRPECEALERKARAKGIKVIYERDDF